MIEDKLEELRQTYDKVISLIDELSAEVVKQNDPIIRNVTQRHLDEIIMAHFNEMGKR